MPAAAPPIWWHAPCSAQGPWRGLTDGTVKCWGPNTYGELGNGSTQDSPTPVPVTGLTGVTAISMGARFACAILTNKTIQCWGSNDVGEFGNGSTMGSNTPVAQGSLTNTVAIAAAFEDNFMCALLADMTVQCWGNNLSMQLANGSRMNSSVPVPVAGSGLGNARAIAAGFSQACAVLTNGTLACWGG